MPKLGSTKRRKPSDLKEREGTLKMERENKLAPKPHPGIPPAPPYLSDTEKEAWGQFAEVLHTRYKVLSKEHFALFEALVVCFDQMRSLDHEIRSNDPTVETTRFDKHGNAISTISMHPAWAARRAAGQELRQLCGCFGLSPADVGRVSKLEPAEPKKEKPEDEFGSAA